MSWLIGIGAFLVGLICAPLGFWLWVQYRGWIKGDNILG